MGREEYIGPASLIRVSQHEPDLAAETLQSIEKYNTR